MYTPLLSGYVRRVLFVVALVYIKTTAYQAGTMAALTRGLLLVQMYWRPYASVRSCKHGWTLGTLDGLA